MIFAHYYVELIPQWLLPASMNGTDDDDDNHKDNTKEIDATHNSDSVDSDTKIQGFPYRVL